jgi:hypothetical protein
MVEEQAKQETCRSRQHADLYPFNCLKNVASDMLRLYVSVCTVYVLSGAVSIQTTQH